VTYTSTDSAEPADYVDLSMHVLSE